MNVAESLPLSLLVADEPELDPSQHPVEVEHPVAVGAARALLVEGGADAGDEIIEELDRIVVKDGVGRFLDCEQKLPPVSYRHGPS